MKSRARAEARPPVRCLKDGLRRYFGYVQYVSVGLGPLYELTSKLRKVHRIPVLVYHKVTAIPQVAARLTCAVSSAAFEAQMSWLRDGGYRPISLDDYTAHLLSAQPFPARSVLITFDDGYRSTYSRAYPVLRRYRFPAAVFVTTGSIGELRFPRDQKYRAQGTELADELVPMTWQEIDAIADLIAIGGHSVTHARLGQLSAQRVEWEVRECKRQIEARGIGPVTSFAYPDGIRYHGDYNESTRRALIAAGYKVAFNSEIGRNHVGDDPYCQRRIEPRQADTRSLFESKLMGGYDWVGGAQAAFHRVFAPDAAE